MTLARLRIVREQLDAVSEDAARRFGASCRAGCADCCHSLVQVSEAEGADIASRTLAREDWLEIAAALREDALASRALSPTAYFQLARSCAFLDAERRCSIYDVRPAVCRLHLVASPPERCSPRAKADVTIIDLRPLKKALVAEFGIAGSLQDVVLRNMIRSASKQRRRAIEALDSRSPPALEAVQGDIA